MKFDRLVLVVLLLVLPVAFWPGSTSYDPLKFTLLALAGASWLGSAAWRLGTGRPLVRPANRLLAAGLALVAVLSVSAVNAHHAGLVWRTVILTALWLAVVLQTAAAADSRSWMRRLLAAGVVSGVAVSLYGLAQIAGWVPGAPAESGYPPGISTLGNQNQVGGLAALLLWPSFVLWTGSSMLRRSAAVGATVILAVTVVMSKAAGPLLAATGSLLLVGPAMVMVRRGMAGRVPLVFGSLLVFCTFAGSLLAVDALRPSAPENSLALHRRIFRENHGDIRRTDWLVARELFRSSPWTGKGAGNYAALWPDARARLQAESGVTGLADHEPLAVRAHNDLFQFLGETGVPGGLWLMVGAGMAVGFWRRRWRTFPDDPTRTSFLWLTAGATTAVLHAMVSFPVHLAATALMLALITGLMAAPVFAGHAADPAVWKGRRLLAVLPAAVCLLLAAGAVQEFVGDLHTASGRRAYSAGRLAPAISSLEKGDALRRWPAENHLYLGLAKLGVGNAGEARDHLEQSLAAKPTFEGYLALAELDIDEGRFGEAGELLAVVEGCRPYQAFRLQAEYLRGLSELRQGHREKARPLLRALLEDDPYNQRAWLALGYQEVLDGNPDQGRLCYRRALDIIEWKIRDAGMSRSSTAPGEIVRLNRHRETARKALESLQ